MLIFVTWDNHLGSIIITRGEGFGLEKILEVVLTRSGLLLRPDAIPNRAFILSIMNILLILHP